MQISDFCTPDFLISLFVLSVELATAVHWGAFSGLNSRLPVCGDSKQAATGGVACLLQLRAFCSVGLSARFIG